MLEFYEKIDFVLSGGALKYLSDFLALQNHPAIVMEPRGADLHVLDATGVSPEKLILKGESASLNNIFPKSPVKANVEIDQAESQGEWPWVIRLRGYHWTLYILLKDKADEAFLKELHPYAGFLRLWQTFQRIDMTEKRLSRLSYMILATKSTLASIFEPMPLNYFVDFIYDVLRESLFPRSISIFKDDGSKLTLLSGDELAPPLREGLFAQLILPSTPVITKAVKTDNALLEVVLPISEADSQQRLFCITKWDELPNEETINFLELLGSLAARAMTINNLRISSSKAEGQISSDYFSMLSLSNVLNALKQKRDAEQFISLTSDIFSELGQITDSFIAVKSTKKQGYIPVEYRKDGIKTSFEAGVMPLSSEPSDVTTLCYDLSQVKPGLALHQLGLTGTPPWEQLNHMQHIFPFCVADNVEGFIAVASSISSMNSQKLAALSIVAQFVALEIKRFEF